MPSGFRTCCTFFITKKYPPNIYVGCDPLIPLKAGADCLSVSAVCYLKAWTRSSLQQLWERSSCWWKDLHLQNHLEAFSADTTDILSEMAHCRRSCVACLFKEKLCLNGGGQSYENNPVFNVLWCEPSSLVATLRSSASFLWIYWSDICVQPTKWKRLLWDSRAGIYSGRWDAGVCTAGSAFRSPNKYLSALRRDSQCQTPLIHSPPTCQIEIHLLIQPNKTPSAVLCCSVELGDPFLSMAQLFKRKS